MAKWRSLSADGNTVTLRKFTGDFQLAAYATPVWLASHLNEVGCGACVDVETTGLSPESERVIEVGVRLFWFLRSSGQLLALDRSFAGYQDPGKPLSREISDLTGIQDVDLSGKVIDWQAVKALLESAEIIIAHNAAFDRPFLEKEIGGRVSRVWACTLRQIPWAAKGFGVLKLEILSAYHGFFTDAHRALNDVDALLHLISFEDESSGKPYLSELIVNAHHRQFKLIALDSPFESRGALKSRGFRWDTMTRAWGKICNEEQLAVERAWLETEVYRGEFKGEIAEIPLDSRFLPA